MQDIFMCRLRIQSMKDAFIQANPRAEYGISAAVRHNKLYSPATTNRQRRMIRDYWKALLDELGEKYDQPQTTEVFFADILELQRRMNDQFDELFCDDGFKVSHAQKSISVYLKTRWCLNEIPTPPLCPVDSTVLNLLGRPWNNHPWTRMSFEEYQHATLEISRRAALAGLSVAVWELILFNNRQDV